MLGDGRAASAAEPERPAGALEAPRDEPAGLDGGKGRRVAQLTGAPLDGRGGPLL